MYSYPVKVTKAMMTVCGQVYPIIYCILILQYSFVTLVTNARVTNASPEVDQFEEVLRNLPLLVLELILYLCD